MHLPALNLLSKVTNTTIENANSEQEIVKAVASHFNVGVHKQSPALVTFLVIRTVSAAVVVLD